MIKVRDASRRLIALERNCKTKEHVFLYWRTCFVFFFFRISGFQLCIETCESQGLLTGARLWKIAVEFVIRTPHYGTTRATIDFDSFFFMSRLAVKRAFPQETSMRALCVLRPDCVITVGHFLFLHVTFPNILLLLQWIKALVNTQKGHNSLKYRVATTGLTYLPA